MSRSLLLEVGNSVVNGEHGVIMQNALTTGTSMATYNLLGLMVLGVMIALSVRAVRNG